MTVEHTISFLTAGPTFTFTLPADLDRRPEVSSPVDLGSGFGRSLIYRPYESVEQFPTDRFRLVAELPARDGPMLAFERNEKPLNWFLVWPLAEGSLVSFMKSPEVKRGNDALGLARATIAAESVELREYGGSAPMAVLHPPLAATPSRLPGWGEYIVFSDRTGTRSVQLSRPGSIRAGKRRLEEHSEGARVRNRGGTEVGVDVEIQGNFTAAESDEVLSAMAAALTY